MRIVSRYVFPFTDFAFKKLFGQEKSKQFLIDFLNALIRFEKAIVAVRFLNTERLGKTKELRKSVFDIFCEDEDGNKFIIEIQRVFKPYLMDRAIYYSTFAIQEQSERGVWDFNIKKTYTVCLLDYCFDKHHPVQVVHTFKLVDTENNDALEQLIIYNIELPKFRKKEDELENRLDWWLYVLNNLVNFEDIPLFLNNDKVFKEFFMEAEVANLSKQVYWDYVASMADEWEANRTKAALKQREEEGEEKGMEKGIQLMLEAAKMKKAGESIEKIIQQTGLDPQFVVQL